jgi:glycosyltransferase involved in cell wall biosynthesis
MITPKVSCIMPTANRANYVPLSIYYFLNQEYRNAELIIIDDGRYPIRNLVPEHHRIKYYYTASQSSVGVKRNYACEKASGSIIVHWDDDDYYAQDWIGRQVEVLESNEADIVGLNHIVFFSPLVNRYWQYEDKNIVRPWLSGATLAYYKDFWRRHPFRDLDIGEDYDFIWNSGAIIFAYEYFNGFVATLHALNTTLKPFENPRHKKHAKTYMYVDYKGYSENPK